MLVSTYYFSSNGIAFEKETLRKSYEKHKNDEAYSKFTCVVWGKTMKLDRLPLGDKLEIFKGGYISAGVFRSMNFLTEADALEYEIFSTNAQNKWRDYMKEAIPEDMITDYDDMFLKELPSYEWTLWGDERPMPNTEIMLLERFGRGSNISFDKYDGTDFERAYHLDIIAWKPVDPKAPANDPWALYSSRRKLKKSEFTLYRKLK